MLSYDSNLKDKARELRKNLTDSERALWSRLRRKQLLGVQFYRQKPIGNYIVDFYAARPRLVVEVDGSQHFENGHAARDKHRDEFLRDVGIAVLRFTSREVLEQLDSVVQAIYQTIVERIHK